MAYNIHITDLLYNSKNVDNNSDFILIHSDDMDNILFKLGYMNQTTIYDYNVEYIRKILSVNNLNFDNFVFVYQIQIEKINDLKYIIMANKEITKTIHNCVTIDIDAEGNRLWLPQDPKYSYIGLIYTPPNKEPTYKHHALIDNAFLHEDFNNKIYHIDYPNIKHLDISKNYVKHRLTRKMFSYNTNQNVLYYDVKDDNTNYYNVDDGKIKLNNSKNPWFEYISNTQTSIPISTHNDFVADTDIEHDYKIYKIISLLLIFIIITCLLIRIVFY